MTSFVPSPPPIQHQKLKQTSLSFSQESLWFLQQLDPENIAYNSNYLVKFSGGVVLAPLERALNELVRRHEPLRTIYTNQGGKPVQIIQPFVPFSLPFEDYSGPPEEEQLTAIRRYVSEHGDQPFNLQRGPIVRFALLHKSNNEDYLFFCTHHIGCDGWSWQIILSELAQSYEAFRSSKVPDLPELPVQYSDYTIWQRKWLSGETLQASIDHWKNILSGELPILEFPTDRPRPAVQSFRGARYHFGLQQGFSAQMKEFCQKERLTTFHLLMAGFAVMLMRYSGQEDIILGCPFANRSRGELDGLVGLFVNTLPIRLNLQGNPISREFLQQVHSTMLDAFTWQAAPFEALVSEISAQRDLSRTPIFQVVINLRNVPRRQAIVEGLEIESRLRENAPSPFDLSLEFDEGNEGTLEASIQYNVDLYDENSIIHLVSHYQNLLAELMVKTDRPLAELEMLTPSERQRFLSDWNDHTVDFPQVCIHDLVSDQVEKTGSAIAVECNGNSLTYSELESRANQLANYLKASGIVPGDRIGIYLPRSEAVIVTLLAVLKAGAAYVPLDMTYPKERVTYMVEDSQPAAIITLSNLTNQLSETTRKICLDTESVSIADCETRKPGLTSQNDILAYIIYTSGSTGRPKGTMNVHSGIVNYLTFMKRKFQFCPADRIVQFTSFSFDVSTFEIFLTLSSGGTLFVMDDTQVRDPNYIYTKMVDVQATYLSCVPTMLRALCESAFAGQPKENTLRLILPAGEPLRGVDVVLTRKAFGNAALLVNQYGPTECSIIQTTYNIPDALPNGLQTVPIGKPIDNARMYVLDSYFHPVPPGAKGELFIGGVCVGPGYWKLPEQTMDRFQPDPFFPGGRIYRTGDVVRQLQDGTICYLGRSDNQVKIRGYRVELGEIESVVNEFPGVKDAVVILWRREDSETLAAYITIAEGYRGLDLDQLHASLAERLPFYMRPSFVRIMNEMPLTPTRKIDRRALPPPESGLTTDRYIAPRNETESRLVSIWQEILEVERIGVRDNFFELGGHSLLAVRLFTRIQEEFGQSLPLMLLFQEGSVEATARALAGDAKLIHPQGIIPIQPRGSELPIFIISAGLYMRELAMALGSSRPVYGLDSTQNGEVEYRKSVQETARIYCDNLIHFYPQGPYILLGHSGHGFFTLELARLLIRTGHDVAFLGLLDTYPPEIGRKANPVNWVKRYASNFKNKNLRKTLQFLGNSVQHFIARRLGRAGMENRIMDQYKMQGKGKKIRRLLLDSYHPEAFDGHVKIFTCAIRPSFMQRDSMQEWAHFITGQLEFVQIPGDHMSALHSPHVAFLADKIEAFLPHRKNDQR